MTEKREPTLHEALAAVGWSSSAPGEYPGTRLVRDADGDVVGSLTASAAWAILRERGLYQPTQETGETL